jgi:hypothetical protein
MACSKKEYRSVQDKVIVSAKSSGEESTVAGNLITTAMREVHKLDIVLYPSEYIQKDVAGILSENSRIQDLENILNIYPDDTRDNFRLGYMKGRGIKEFIRQRSLERFNVDLEVAGARYDILFKGGRIISEQYGFENTHLDNSRTYLVALSDHLIRPGNVFPPYQYRNSIDRVYSETSVVISAKDSLKKYLASNKTIPLLSLKRAVVRHTKPKNVGFKEVNEIQGISFLSPFYGDFVSTKGIVTASAELDNAPSGFIAYIQSSHPDSSNLTSEGIKLHFDTDPKIKIGDLVEISGLVFEETDNAQNSLTTTSIRNISQIKIISSNNLLPKAIEIKSIPENRYSTYVGDLNLKPFLNRSDAIDFWESLEGMRVSINSPKIAGFRGGNETFSDSKRNLTLYVVPETNSNKLLTDMGGFYTIPEEHIFNPDMLTIASGPLTKGLDTSLYYNVGDTINGQIEGLVTFTKNIFGEGEYLFQIPQESDALNSFNQSKTGGDIVALANRPKLSGVLDSDSLVIAAYNIKNLSSISDDKPRLLKTAQMIQENLSCPDVLGLVEIQDNNGEDFGGTSQANKTIKNLISYIPKTGPCQGVNYKSININPLSHREGGVPGANIRVAMIYNQNRLSFMSNPAPGPLTETVVMPDGHLNYNPGRIAPNSLEFRNTRKSIVAEFTFRDKPVFVIVNHFNSKISDTSHFSAIQPVVRNTEVKRAKLAGVISNFVGMIERNNSDANIAVIGDFNAYVNEMPMKVIESDRLYNLIRELPRYEWYTTNHNGNSQSLDYIFVNKNLRSRLRSFQIPQVNSDFMGRLSDHDPVVSIFDF